MCREKFMILFCKFNSFAVNYNNNVDDDDVDDEKVIQKPYFLKKINLNIIVLGYECEGKREE